MRAAGLLVAASLFAAGPLPPPHRSGQSPSFRSGVEVLEVDARVFDSDGGFVRDLAVDDFELLEDGQPQQIQTLFLVGGAASPGGACGVGRRRAAREMPRVAHTWIFVLDQRHMGLNGFVRARDAITSFLAERFRDSGGALPRRRYGRNCLQ